MTNFKLSLLAAAALGAVSIGSASAMPLGTTPAAGESTIQNARVVCDQWGRCYETRNQHRSSRHYSSYDDGYRHNRRGYRNSNRVVGFGPFGIWTY